VTTIIGPLFSSETVSSGGYMFFQQEV
jgi:hypothetical protein